MLDVRIFHSIADLAPFRAELDRINRDSRRRSPFSTIAYSEGCLDVDPTLRTECDPWISVAFEDGRPVGYLALRLVSERVGPIPSHKLEHLPTRGADRPHLVARPEDEARVSDAIVKHLSQTRGWSLLTLTQQDATSELRAPIHAISSARRYVRELDDRQTTTVPIAWKTLSEYVAALSRKHRSHVKRMTLDTLKSGKMTAVRSSDPKALPALLDLYLSIEKRSWKGGGEASMGGSPWREPLTRWLIERAEPMALTIEILLDDEKPICGTITGDYERCVYFLYTVFDDAYSAVSPGAPMLLFAIERAIRGGFEAFNMLPDYAYYKRRWLGEVTDTKTIQVYRAPSVLHAKARLGEARRWLQGEGERAAALFNPERRATAKPAPATGEDADGAEEKEAPAVEVPKVTASASDRALVAKLRAIDHVTWRTGADLLASTPFAEVKRAKAASVVSAR